MREVTISNECITAVISSMGAEMKSAKFNGKEKLWCGDPDVWARQTPILFPICGALRDGKFIYEGKEYDLRMHGFALISEFEVESVTDDSATFLLKSSEETKEWYPFDFEFRVTYTLVGSKIDITYSVKNMTDGDMYFSIGGHEGYACPEGIEEYDIIFSEPETFNATLSDDSLLTNEYENVGVNTNVFPLKNEQIKDLKMVVFENLKSRSLELKNRNTGEGLKIEYDGFDYMVIWHVPDSPYICIEPWCGVNDSVDSNHDITSKKGIIKLSKGEESVKCHSIIF